MTRFIKDRRQLLVLLAAVLLAGGWLLRPAAVNVVPLAEQPVRETLLLTGRVETRQRATLSALVKGTVARVAVDEGDAVTAGQLLLLTGDPESAAAVAQASAALAQAEARRARLRDVDRLTARSDADNAELARKQAARQLKNIEALYSAGSVSEEELLAAREALQRAEREAASLALRAGSLDGGRDARLADAEVAQAAAARELAIARQSQLRVLAPSAGMIVRRLAEPGMAVQPGTPLLEFAPGAAPEVRIDVDERFLGQLRDGQPVTVVADAFPEAPLAGAVSRVAPRVDAERGAVDVRVQLQSPPPWLREDMTVSVEILVGENPAARVLPLAALRDLDSKPWAWCVQDDRVRRCEPLLGLRDARFVEVLGGIEPGALVITDERAFNEGDRVRAVKATD